MYLERCCQIREYETNAWILTGLEEQKELRVFLRRSTKVASLINRVIKRACRVLSSQQGQGIQVQRGYARPVNNGN